MKNGVLNFLKGEIFDFLPHQILAKKKSFWFFVFSPICNCRSLEFEASIIFLCNNHLSKFFGISGSIIIAYWLWGCKMWSRSRRCGKTVRGSERDWNCPWICFMITYSSTVREMPLLLIAPNMDFIKIITSVNHHSLKFFCSTCQKLQRQNSKSNKPIE